MSALETETDIKKPVQATEAVDVIDCGRVSERTQGTVFLILFERGIPPNNKLLM